MIVQCYNFYWSYSKRRLPNALTECKYFLVIIRAVNEESSNKKADARGNREGTVLVLTTKDEDAAGSEGDVAVGVNEMSATTRIAIIQSSDKRELTTVSVWIETGLLRL